jgi:hypothetical protein
MSSRIRCHVIEVPAEDNWLARRGGSPRELLPWADPYIATLMRRLDRRGGGFEDLSASDPFADEDDNSGAIFDDGWQEDAFMPPSSEAPRFHSYPPVFGGFPLLEDE